MPNCSWIASLNTHRTLSLVSKPSAFVLTIHPLLLLLEYTFFYPPGSIKMNIAAWRALSCPTQTWQPLATCVYQSIKHCLTLISILRLFLDFFHIKPLILRFKSWLLQSLKESDYLVKLSQSLCIYNPHDLVKWVQNLSCDHSFFIISLFSKEVYSPSDTHPPTCITLPHPCWPLDPWCVSLKVVTVRDGAADTRALKQ